MSRAPTVPTRLRRPSRGYIHDSSSGSNNGVYGDDGDLIQGHHAPGVRVGRVQGGSSRDAMVVAVLDPVGKAPLSRTRPAVSVEATTEVTRWLLRFGKPHWLASGWASAGSTSDSALPGWDA
ncbi:hypothetical protein EDB83DRAFT_2519592 [Lactarius deliciosus]|nr:hypothetical protein EDB83DRAFT_2519592 [Lactarius deliciosus]